MAMSYRCPYRLLQGQEGKKGLLFKESQIPYAQPIPLVNRIHPTRFPEILKITGDLSENFLNSHLYLSASLKDAHVLNRLFSFEDYCEAESTVYGRRRLGYTCMLTGKVRFINDCMMIVSDITNPELTLEMRLAPYLKRELEMRGIKSLDVLTNKIVRMLAIAWYYYSRKKPNIFEVLYLEPCNDLLEAVTNDIAGYVRMRGRVTLEELERLYGSRSLDFRCRNLLFDGMTVSWHRPLTQGSNEIIKSFVKVMNKLKEMRALEGRGIITLDNVLNRDMLIASKYAGIIKNKGLQQPLMRLIRIEDEMGYLNKVSEVLKDMEETSLPVEEIIYYLKGLKFLIKKSNKTIGLSNFAYKVAYVAIREDVLSTLEGIFKRHNWVDIFELMRIKEYPFSMLLAGVRELEESGKILPVRYPESHLRLAWRHSKFDVELDKIHHELSLVISQIEKEVLNVLLNVAHPISTIKIVEEMRSRDIPISITILEQFVLPRLRSKRHIEETSKGMWFYPWEQRILDFLRSNPERLFAKREIMESIRLPAIYHNLLDKALNELVSKNLVESVGEYFAIRSRDPEVMRKRMEHFIEREAICTLFKILKTCRRMDKLTLEAKMRCELTLLMRNIGCTLVNVNNIVDRVITRLSEEGRLEIINDIVYIL
ncbi:MAG: hypothetical protein QXR45_10520 [Candidatus Bathyarchaeia archaeon]